MNSTVNLEIMLLFMTFTNRHFVRRLLNKIIGIACCRLLTRKIFMNEYVMSKRRWGINNSLNTADSSDL